MNEKDSFGLVGNNGAGKSTLFKAITKEIRLDSGSIYIFNKNINENFNEIKRYIGYCPQTNPLFDYMTVKEIIEFYIKLKKSNTKAKIICEKFGLGSEEEDMKKLCMELSGGNKRKLSLAIAMMNNPKILLLDEPTSSFTVL